MKCPCNNCSEHLEFEESAAGETVKCPHCGMDTVLFVPPVPLDSRQSEPESAPKFMVPKAAHSYQWILALAGAVVFWFLPSWLLLLCPLLFRLCPSLIEGFGLWLWLCFYYGCNAVCWYFALTLVYLLEPV